MHARMHIDKNNNNTTNVGDGNSDSTTPNSYNTDFISIFGGDDRHGVDNHGSTSGNIHSNNSQNRQSSSTMLLGNNEHLSNFNSDITPNILLEQLAYVDNFMPSLEQDFLDINSLVLMDGFQQTNNTIFDETNTDSDRLDVCNVWGLDERLARELSAFADDSFVFHDEDKPNPQNDSGADGNVDTNSNDNINNAGGDNKKNGSSIEHRQPNKRSNHFLTQRRNDILKSQYDHSKSRFSSNRNRNQSSNSINNTNKDINDDFNENESNFNHFDNNLEPGVANSKSNSNNEDINGPQIELPDYSKIPTPTLVSLFPRVKVPHGAYTTLLERGLKPEQIDAVAVIIAYHEQEKIKNSKDPNSKVETYQHLSTDYLLKHLSPSSKENTSGSSSTYQDNGLINLLYELSTKTALKLNKKSSSNEHDSITSNISVKQPISSNSRFSSEAEIPSVSKDLDLKRTSSLEANLEKLEPKNKKQKVNESSSLPSTTKKVHQKRKMKEEELESSVHELSELAVSLQQRINTLEMENKLLKNLVLNSGKLDGTENAETIKRTILEKNRNTVDSKNEN